MTVRARARHGDLEAGAEGGEADLRLLDRAGRHELAGDHQHDRGDEQAGDELVRLGAGDDAADHVEGGADGVGPEEDPRQAHQVEGEHPLQDRGDLARAAPAGRGCAAHRSFTHRSVTR